MSESDPKRSSPEHSRPGPLRADSSSIGRGRRTTGLLAVLFFAAYVVNMLVGKLSTVLGARQPIRLPDLPEVMLLLAAVVLFVVTTLLAEAEPTAD